MIKHLSDGTIIQGSPTEINEYEQIKEKKIKYPYYKQTQNIKN